MPALSDGCEGREGWGSAHAWGPETRGEGRVSREMSDAMRRRGREGGAALLSLADDAEVSPGLASGRVSGRSRRLQSGSDWFQASS